MQCGTPRGDLIATEAGLKAPSIATVMDGPKAMPVWETGRKPVLAEAAHDDHVVCLQVNFLSYAWRPIALEVHIKDSVWTPPSTGADGGLHLGR